MQSTFDKMTTDCHGYCYPQDDQLTPRSVPFHARRGIAPEAEIPSRLPTPIARFYCSQTRLVDLTAPFRAYSPARKQYRGTTVTTDLPKSSFWVRDEVVRLGQRVADRIIYCAPPSC